MNDCFLVADVTTAFDESESTTETVLIVLVVLSGIVIAVSCFYNRKGW